MSEHTRGYDAPTGSTELPARLVTVPFDRFEITLRVGPNNELIEIVGVAVSKDFLTSPQRLVSSDSYDVTDLYE